jgi:hypothetical protein
MAVIANVEMPSNFIARVSVNLVLMADIRHALYMTLMAAFRISIRRRHES